MGGDALNITNCLLTLSDSRSGTGGREAFFHQQKESMFQDCVTLLRLAGEPVTTRSIADIILTLPTHPILLQTPETIEDADLRARANQWRAGLTNQCCLRGFQREKTPIESADYRRAKDNLIVRWPVMADRTRSGIEADCMGTLAVLNGGLIGSLIAADSTVGMGNLENGDSILINMSPTVYGETGRIISVFAKFVAQKWLLARKANPGDQILTIVSDEAQNVANKEDGQFLQECRSHYGAMVYLTQSINNLYGAMGHDGENQTRSLLGGFGYQLMFTLGDYPTAKYASELIGSRKQVFVSGSEREELTIGDELMGKNGWTASYSHQIVPILETNVFMGGMRAGRGIVQAIAIKNGEPWSNSEQFIPVAFNQPK